MKSRGISYTSAPPANKTSTTKAAKTHEKSSMVLPGDANSFPWFVITKGSADRFQVRKKIMQNFSEKIASGCNQNQTGLSSKWGSQRNLQNSACYYWRHLIITQEDLKAKPKSTGEKKQRSYLEVAKNTYQSVFQSTSSLFQNTERVFKRTIVEAHW
jgi:hypothetical protein